MEIKSFGKRPLDKALDYVACVERVVDTANTMKFSIFRKELKVIDIISNEIRNIAKIAIGMINQWK